MAHSIGDTVWFKGDEVVITTEPYELCGGTWQDAITESGSIVCLATPEYIEDSVNMQKEDWKEQQQQFRNLTTN
jgi:hypothetical protein